MIFVPSPIEQGEVRKAISKLHNKKAAVFDDISAEHIKYAGPALVYLLCLIFNFMVQYEYVPLNLRKGIQVPLYKGKKMDNYRGITLLSSFNKIFEMVIWNWISGWWKVNGIILSLQSACWKGQSCLHKAFLLQETVCKALNGHRNALVAFYDVSKALTLSGQTVFSTNSMTWVYMVDYGVFYIGHIKVLSVEFVLVVLCLFGMK